MARSIHSAPRPTGSSDWPGSSSSSMFVHRLLRRLASAIIGTNDYAPTPPPTRIQNYRRFFVKAVTGQVKLAMGAQYPAFVDAMFSFNTQALPYHEHRRLMRALLDHADYNNHRRSSWEIAHHELLEETEMMENPMVAIPIVLYALLFSPELHAMEYRRHEGLERSSRLVMRELQQLSTLLEHAMAQMSSPSGDDNGRGSQ